MIKLYWTEIRFANDNKKLFSSGVSPKKLWVFEDSGGDNLAKAEFWDGVPNAVGSVLVARIHARNGNASWQKGQENEVFPFSTAVWVKLTGTAIVAMQTMGNPTGPSA